METMRFDYPAEVPVRRRAHVGVVSSGDLEILLSPPRNEEQAHVEIRTTATGFRDIWRAILNRFFSRYEIAADLIINDFGATPGMVGLRLTQAMEESGT